MATASEQSQPEWFWWIFNHISYYMICPVYIYTPLVLMVPRHMHVCTFLTRTALNTYFWHVDRWNVKITENKIWHIFWSPNLCLTWTNKLGLDRIIYYCLLTGIKGKIWINAGSIWFGRTWIHPMCCGVTSHGGRREKEEREVFSTYLSSPSSFEFKRMLSWKAKYRMK